MKTTKLGGTGISQAVEQKHREQKKKRYYNQKIPKENEYIILGKTNLKHASLSSFAKLEICGSSCDVHLFLGRTNLILWERWQLVISDEAGKFFL